MKRRLPSDGAAPAEPHRHYRSYLLRMWRARDAGDGPWRASIESVQTGERVSFAELADLLAFLRRQTHDLSNEGGVNGGV